MSKTNYLLDPSRLPFWSLWSILALLAVAGCSRETGDLPQTETVSSDDQTTAVTSTATAGSEESDKAGDPLPSATTTAVARVVFIDKENACACTRERCQLSWGALRSVLPTDSMPPVEKLYFDSQATQVQSYLQQRSLLTLPGIYFLASDGEIVTMLQGEVTTEQIRRALAMATDEEGS
jgi:hypothetical protein